MKITNPIIKGFYPDPSCCEANGKYYLVCSTMQYFPGVPIFESEDLINWKQIGNCFTRDSQVNLNKVQSSSGVFAPTIRYYDGVFYMTTTNNETHQNYYVSTDNIYGEWSEPIYVDQDGIDPSFYFENGRAYFMSNGSDDDGVHGIVQCEIDIKTGKKLSKSKTIWQGSGGRYLEGPHMYKINGKYYLVAAEGGTEYGHMVTYAVSDSLFGEFVGYPNNPVLTNRNLGGYQVQGVGHGDLVKDKNGNWWMVHLGFRQIDRWLTYHHLGRETFLTPVEFHDDGWFTAGINGTTPTQFETDKFDDNTVQENKTLYTFENTDFDLEWCYIRNPKRENYSLKKDCATLYGTDITLNDVDSPTFIGIRQKDFVCDIECEVSIDAGEGGITIFMDENQHYDVAIRKTQNGYEAISRLTIGEAVCIKKSVPINSCRAKLKITSNNYSYNFFLVTENDTPLGYAQTRYLSTEVAAGFTGVFIGLYATGNNKTEFKGFKINYK